MRRQFAGSGCECHRIVSFREGSARARGVERPAVHSSGYGGIGIMAFAATDCVFGANKLKLCHKGESTMPDYVSPTDLLPEAGELAKKKSELSVGGISVR